MFLQTETHAVEAIDEMARCAFCKYDLRGNPDGLCPECGASHAERARKLDERRALKRIVTTVVMIVVLGPVVVPLVIMLLVLVTAIGVGQRAFLTTAAVTAAVNIAANTAR